MKLILCSIICYFSIAGSISLASSFEYINYNFENGSPLFYEVQTDSSVLISLIYDNERNSPNRASGHWHFQVFAKKGSRMKLVLQNFKNIWNGRTAYVGTDNTSCYLSVDGKNWKFIETTLTPEKQLEIDFIMPDDSVYIARMEPYRISDLEKLKSEIENHPLIQITEIGHTVENRPLEIIRIGNESAPNRLLLRGRAHAWEPGGNWVLQGLIKNLLKDDDPKINKYLERYCIYILPMANKDRVAHGGTRFNLQGKDLNRNWDKKTDPYLTPENAALEKWLIHQIELGLKPDLAIDFHNDAEGGLHISRPEIDIDSYLANMERLELLLRKFTWFTEGSSGPNWRNPGTIGEGLLERYGIDGLIYELNADWIAGLDKVPFGKDWMSLGEQLCEVFYYYFDNDN